MKKITSQQLKQKRCSQCNKPQPLKNFHKAARQSDGLRPECRICHNEKKKIAERIRSAIMKLWFEGKQCVDCGETDVRVLQNDHIENNKSHWNTGTNIRCLMQNSTPNIVDELKKCEIVCIHCHRLRTFQRLEEHKTIKLNHTNNDIYDQYSMKRSLANEYKIAIGKCQICDFWDPLHLFLFDFDHRNPKEKILSISAMVHQHKPINMIIEEITKCDLLCAKCHMIKTSIELKYKILSDFTQGELEKAQKYFHDS